MYQLTFAKTKTKSKQTEQLTGREREITLAMCRGLTNREIAIQMDLSADIIDSYIEGIMEKKRCYSRVETIMALIRDRQG